MDRAAKCLLPGKKMMQQQKMQASEGYRLLKVPKDIQYHFNCATPKHTPLPPNGESGRPEGEGPTQRLGAEEVKAQRLLRKAKELEDFRERSGRGRRSGEFGWFGVK